MTLTFIRCIYEKKIIAKKKLYFNMCLQMIKKYQLWIIILSFLQKKNTRKKNKYQFLFHNRKHLLSAITTILHFFSIISVMPHVQLCFLSVLDALNCLYIIRTTYIFHIKCNYLLNIYIHVYLLLIKFPISNYFSFHKI